MHLKTTHGSLSIIYIPKQTYYEVQSHQSHHLTPELAFHSKQAQ